MKKTIMFLGVLSLSVAHAQQNDGKVGINTETPSATLSVKSKTGNNGSTKNLELENATGNKLVTVLDDGNVGIGVENPAEKLDINGNARVRNLLDGTGIAHFPYTVVSKNDGTLGKEKVHFMEYIANDNNPNLKTETSRYALLPKMVVPMYFSMNNTSCANSNFFTYFTLYYRDGRFVYKKDAEHSQHMAGGTKENETNIVANASAEVKVQGNYTDHITLTYETRGLCSPKVPAVESTVLKISRRADGRIEVTPTKKEGFSRYFISWVPYGVQ